MERFRCQSRCQGQRARKATPDLLVHREFLAEMAETANKGQQAPQGHKVLLVLLVHKAPRERKAHKAFLALLDETAEKANKALLAPLVHKALLARRERRATKATLEAVYQPLTSCLCT